MCNNVAMTDRLLLKPVEPRFEVLPFGALEEQAGQLREPLRLTITASPKQGLDRTADVAVMMRELGHTVTVHLAARMVRDRAHLDMLLERTTGAGIDDLFVVGGDATEPEGPYSSAGELLELLADHPLRPAALGIGAYPEGHPFIDDADLAAALDHKSRLADYMVTQLCFDTEVFMSWLESVRFQGLALPVYIGAPGLVDRRRLLDISVRVGVGPSLRFIRKQRGLRQLFRSPHHAANKFYDGITPYVGDARLGIAGLHFFTFNELVSTWEWERARRVALAAAPAKRRRMTLRRSARLPSR